MFTLETEFKYKNVQFLIGLGEVYRSYVGEESPYRPRLLSSFRNLSQEGVRPWQLPQRPASSRILSPNPRCTWRLNWGRILGNWASPLVWRNSHVNGPSRLVRSKSYSRRSH